ncbi:MAG: tungsten cofactor oxidoreductase radical SAM maturase [Firmicutes bacterium]|nr:tungsten cofactor oxidoreductase radical SAM maturase [Bacillota bacterium]
MSLQKLYLELTNKCNLNCVMCYRHSWSEKLQDMDREVFAKIRKEINGLDRLKSIVLGGIGEPTYAPLIYEAIEELGNYNLTLTTNAVKIDDVLLDLFVQYITLLMVSIDGLHENYSKIRGGDLDLVLNNINKINELKKKTRKNTPYLGIQFVISKNNVDDIFRLIDLAKQFKVHQLVLSNLLPQKEENADKILYTRYENKEIKSLFNKASNYSFRKGINLILPNYELKTERRCTFIEDKAVFINASGEVVPCYRLSHTYKEYVFGREKTVRKHSFGNIHDKSLKEIWESRVYSNFRSAIWNNRYPSCIDCDYVEGCDLVRDTSTDCYTGSPSCADCLWSRKYIICP